MGLLGAGPNLKGFKSEYPLLIDSLAEQGLIESRAFSLDIRALEDDRGGFPYLLFSRGSKLIVTRFGDLWWY